MLFLAPLIAAGIAAAAKGAQGALQKDASDYMADQTRNDLEAAGNYGPGTVGTYTRYNPETNLVEHLVDRGSNADTFSSLNDPYSATSMAFNLGGSPQVAGQLANRFQNRAEQAYNMPYARIDTRAEDALTNRQLGLGDVYRSQMMGQAPSVAALQAGLAQQSNVRNAALAGAVGNPMAMRNAIMSSANMGSQLAAQGAGQRAEESNVAAGKLGSLQGQMSQMGMDRALTQAKLDAQMADYGDQQANRYYGLQQAVLDAQTKAQRQRGAALQQADQGRKDEVFGSAQSAAQRHNRDVDMALGSFSSGAAAAGSLATGVGSSKK